MRVVREKNEGAIISMLTAGSDNHYRIRTKSGSIIGSLFLAVSMLAGSGAPAASFVSVSPMAYARQEHTATLLASGQVLVAGGNGVYYEPPSINPISSAEIYDPTTGEWRTTSSMTTARSDHTATLLTNGQVLVAGGIAPIAGDIGPVSSAETYDPATGVWTATGPMIIARAFHTATLLTNGKVLVAGGQNSKFTVQDSELYDPATRTWMFAGNLNTARNLHTATLLNSGMVLVAGGEGPASGSPLASAELYDPSTEEWTTTGAMNTGRIQQTATLLSDGRVLVAAGASRQPNLFSLASAELYDPSTQQWTQTGALNSARAAHTASLLSNGQVLVTGGQDSQNAVDISSAEVYNPSTEMWTTTPSMSSARSYHTATALANGQVIIAGGELLSSVEVYVPAPGIWLVTRAGMLSDGSFNIDFTSIPGGLFHMRAVTNLAVPLTNWNVLGGVTEVSPGSFQFSDPAATNITQRFYNILSP